MKFSIRIDQLELRTCNNHLTLEQPYTTAEIVAWVDSPGKKSYCYTIARWEKDSEGYSLKMIGNRPFDKDIEQSTFMFLAKQGQTGLDYEFVINEYK